MNSLQPPRILIVEDQVVVARDIRARLVTLGYEPVADTGSGEQALILAEQHRPNLVLMDIHLQGPLDGVEAARQIQERWHVPVVFLTAYAEETTLRRAKTVEPFGYIVKPFEDRELHTTIEIALYKHQAEQRLRASEDEYRTVLRTALDGYWVADAQGRFLEVNDAYCRMTRFSREELLTKTIFDMEADESPDEVRAGIQRVMREGSARFDRRHRRKDEQLIHLEVSVTYLPGKERLYCFLRDVTGRKELEEEREMTVRLLRLLSSFQGLDDLARNVSKLLKDWSCCDAVGIRLRSGEDYPYFETRDLPPDLSSQESFLCARGATGEVLRDESGMAILECLCGGLLQGRLAPGQPGVTPKGSFWSNCAQQWLRDHAQANWLSRLRGRCIEAGFESLALVPLRAGTSTLGLLQLMASRPGRFSPAKIRLLEQMADSLAVAVAHLQAQEKLRVQALVLDQIRDTITVTDMQGRITYVNAEQARKLRCAPEQLIGKTTQSYSEGPAQMARQREVYEQTVANGCWQGELVNVDATGRPFIVECRTFTVRNELGQPVALCGVGTDITARKAAEQALQQSEQRYRDLVETTFDWIWEVDEQGRYTYASPKVRDLLGYTVEEVLGRTPFDLMPEEEAQRVRAIFTNLVRERRFFAALENTNRHKDGHLVILESSGAPVFGPGGEFSGYRGMDRDITERKRVEIQLRQAQKMEAVGQLAGGVAHDFNNILAATMLHLELLLQNTSVPPEVQNSIGELMTQTKRAAALTRQLLLFGRRSVMQARPLDINEVVENLLKMLRRLIGEHIILDWRGKAHLPAILADTGMLEQVVMNLVVNARDALPKGGTIIIATETVTLSPAEVQQNPEARPGRFVRLSVADNGCGMSPGTLKRIFEPFFTTKEAGQGTGLGLATVYGIAKQHQGWIAVESEINRGSVFRVFLPISDQPVAASPDSEPPPAPRGGHETILLVEDESAVRKTVGIFLRRWGYTVFEAADGYEALQIWEANQARVDLLFTDMVMPEGMTGLELAEKLRGAKPGLKVIISSGYSSELFHHGAENVARVRFVPKPCLPADLAMIIRSCLDES